MGHFYKQFLLHFSCKRSLLIVLDQETFSYYFDYGDHSYYFFPLSRIIIIVYTFYLVVMVRMFVIFLSFSYSDIKTII